MLLVPMIRRHFQLRLAVKQHILLTQFDQVTQVSGGREGGRDRRKKGEGGKKERIECITWAKWCLYGHRQMLWASP